MTFELIALNKIPITFEHRNTHENSKNKKNFRNRQKNINGLSKNKVLKINKRHNNIKNNLQHTISYSFKDVFI